MDNAQIVAKLRDNPGLIAEEIGATSVEMNRAFKAGLVIKLGTRPMNRRGRPPVEWAIPGTAGVKQDQRVSDALAAARQRVEDHNAYERSYAALSAARIRFGLGSPEHEEAKAVHKERFPEPPVLPSQSDYAVLGAIIETEGLAA